MSVLEQMLDDLAARAAADPYYADIALNILRPRAQLSAAAIQTKIDQALAGLVRKGGKCGAAVTFLMPIGDTEKPNVSGPQLRFVYTVRVQEIIEINMGPSGTGKSAEEIALHTLQLFHLCMLNGGNCLYADPSTLTPSLEFDPKLTYDVRLRAQGGLPRVDKCALPIIAPGSGDGSTEITLTCATPGAAIYYTTDGSYPYAGNDEAQLYSAPFALGAFAPCTLRAAAELAGYQQSDVNQAVFT